MGVLVPARGALPLHAAIGTDDKRAVRHERDRVRVEDADVVGVDSLREVVDDDHAAEGADREHRVRTARHGDERAQGRIDELPTLQQAIETSDAAAVRHDPHRVVGRTSRRERLLEDERAGVGRQRRGRHWSGRGFDRGRRARHHADSRAGTDRDDDQDGGHSEGRARAKRSGWDQFMASSLFMRSSIGGWVSKRWSKNAGASFSGLAIYNAAVALFATSSGSLSAAILRSADASPGG